MIDIDEALARVLAACVPLAPRRFTVSYAIGLCLAEDVASDIDSPPHDKALVDGYAVRAEDVSRLPVTLHVIEQITAGENPRRQVGPKEATRIMTGAPVPEGAEGVVMLEVTTADDAQSEVRIESGDFKPGQNVLSRGASMRRGEVVLRRGSVIRPVEVGVLSELGRSEVQCLPPPTVAVIPTGDEIVPVEATPGPGQIRNSNGPMLVAQANLAGGVARQVGVGRDNKAQLRALLAEGLQSDVLVISGGVSAGIHDLVPASLAELGVKEIFHKIRLKPGKPLWFGVKEKTLVFGLPGNPVASYVCFELFVRPAMRSLMGLPQDTTPRLRLPISTDFSHRGDRPTFFPARVENVEVEQRVTPLNWHGSSDLRTLVAANAFIQFPAGEKFYPAGALVDVVNIRASTYA